MNEKGNVFDVSTTLMEIDDLPESETDTRSEDPPTETSETEPHYFAERKPLKQADVRRRALGALGVVGGSVVLVTMISAAVGMGNDQPSGEQPSPARAAQSLNESSGPVVQASRPQTDGRPSPDERPSLDEKPRHAAEPRRRPSERRASEDRADARAHRRRHEHAKPAPPPEPEPEPTYSEPESTYTPEPEPTYVPVETAPAPAPSPPPASGGGQEFGIEP